MHKCSYSFQSTNVFEMAINKHVEEKKPKQPQTTSMKIELNSFTGKENFTLWQRRIKYALARQGLNVGFVGENKPETITLEEWDTLDGLARGPSRTTSQTR